MDTLIGSRVFVWSKADNGYYKGIVYEHNDDKCGVMFDSGKLAGVKSSALIQSLDWADDTALLKRIRKQEEYKPSELFKSSTSIIPTRALCKAMFYFIRKYGFGEHKLSTPKNGFFVKKMSGMLAQIQYNMKTGEVFNIGMNPIAFSYLGHFESMAHECVHGWQCDTFQKDFFGEKQGHGESFLTKAAEVAARLGIKIDVTGDTIKYAMNSMDLDDKKVPPYFIGIKRVGNLNEEVYQFAMLRMPERIVMAVTFFNAVLELNSQNIATRLKPTRKPKAGHTMWVQWTTLDAMMAARFIKGGRVVKDDGVLEEINQRGTVENTTKTEDTVAIPDEQEKLQVTPPTNISKPKPIPDNELIEVAMLINLKLDGTFKISLATKFDPTRYQGKPINVYKVYRHEVEPLNLGTIRNLGDTPTLKDLKKPDMLAFNAAIKRVNKTLHTHPKVDAYIKQHWKNWDIQL